MITLDDRELQNALHRLSKTGENPRPFLKAIGETLAASTKRRFETSSAPDGRPWAPNTETTYLSHLGAYKNSFSKRTGKITQKGIERAIAKKPLIGETRSLSSTIIWQLESNDTVAIGSPMEYASTQQFGAKKGEFGNTKRGAPIPWGDISARPFLGVSEEDRRDIQKIVANNLIKS